ncbi:unnamed protein product [Rangifer tarandus platyrhynchus]|uniref:Uncharacterized protein n=1 Tax=Rangifer tarandus platyrhynchus TaxID=3082113 RepID=A0ABN8YNR9_RANTA|nr:unnamed protein product [Rangifer tarandus platyrhynchus]
MTKRSSTPSAQKMVSPRKDLLPHLLGTPSSPQALSRCPVWPHQEQPPQQLSVDVGVEGLAMGTPRAARPSASARTSFQSLRGRSPLAGRAGPGTAEAGEMGVPPRRPRGSCVRRGSGCVFEETGSPR